jgi:hypothetical protein
VTTHDLRVVGRPADVKDGVLVRMPAPTVVLAIPARAPLDVEKVDDALL